MKTKIVEICALILVMIAGIHVSINTILMQGIHADVTTIKLQANEMSQEIQSNQSAILTNQSKVIAMQKELDRRSPIIEGTLKKLTDLQGQLSNFETKLNLHAKRDIESDHPATQPVKP